MSELEKALEVWSKLHQNDPNQVLIQAAARRFANLTSPETWETKVKPMLADRREGCCAQYRKPCGYHEGMADGAEAVLRSVEENQQ